MSKNIKSFHVAHEYDVFSFDVEIDFNQKHFLDESVYKDSGEYVDETIKSDIKLMSMFWSGSPLKSSDFNEHLAFFIEIFSKAVANYIYEESSQEEWINKEFNDREGYVPLFGEGKGIRIKNIEFDHEFLGNGIYIREKD